ncbi:unnamed protein product [Lymnaea stagnalis]|uniref:Uncharacterized protein n=1 Tax=Lymnaea stagnalis TaxID=6523 RepID=A0AAV2HGG7_LYMST
MCVESDSVSQRINLFSQLGYSYTDLACKRSCHQVKLLNECRCYEEDVPGGIDAMKILAGIDKDDMNFSFCDSNYLECLDRENCLYEREALGCTELCPPACSKVSFLRSASQAEWPVDEYYDHVIRKVDSSYKARNKTYAFIGAPQDHVRKIFLRLEIYYESINSILFC